MDDTLKKAIESRAKELNHGYLNKSDPKIVRTDDIGKVRLHTLTFVGANDRFYTNYVTEFKGDLRAFRRLEDTVPEINKGFGLIALLVEHARYVALGTLAIALVGSTCYLFIAEKTVPDTLVNLVVLMLGYLAGTKAAKQ